MKAVKMDRKRIKNEQFNFHGGKFRWGKRMPWCTETVAQAMELGARMAADHAKDLTPEDAQRMLDSWYVTRERHDMLVEVSTYAPNRKGTKHVNRLQQG